ncbi:MAG: hypothetical protein GF334_10305 [Candidatus Altiarchaeales archaeon]|nr:hypothetical protein [Candidatus Altiarchaeales archaeon]
MPGSTTTHPQDSHRSKPTMKIQQFDSIDEMFAELSGQRQAARESAENNRSFLENFRDPGSCFLRIHPYGFIIYAQVEGSDYEEDQAVLEASFNDGYIFCEAFSEACPGGELGSIHVSTINAAISREGFEWARENGWPTTITQELQGFITALNPDQGFH